MAEKRTIELNIVDNANQTQQQFENLRQQIAKTTQEVDELTSAYGENSQEVSEAKAKLNELTTSYTNLNKVATDTGATFADVYGEMQPLTTRMGEAEDRLYELALAGQTASQEYKDLLAATQNYLRVQQAVDLQVDAGAVPAAQKMTMAVGGVAGAFSVAEGTAAMFGVESQKLQETMMRLQAAMTITQGLASFKEAIPTFTSMADTLKKTSVAQNLLSAATAAYNFVIGASSTALKLFRAAMVSTGIGALIVGIGLLIANFDKVISLFQPLINGFKAIGDFIGITDFAAKQKAENDKKRTEQELKQLEKIRAAREKNFNNEQAAYDREIKLQEALGKSTLELQKAKINASIKYQETKKKELEQDLLAIELGQRMLGNILGAEFEESITGYQNKINEIANNIENQKTDLKILDIEVKKAAQQTPISTGGGVSLPEKQVKEKLDLTRQRIDKEIALIEDGYEKEKRLLEERAKREKEDLAASVKDKIYNKEEYAKTEKLIEDNLKKDLKELNSKYFDGELKARDFSIESLKNNKIKELEIEVAANEEKARIQKEYDEAEKERIEQLNKDKFQLAKDGLQLVSELSSLFGQQDEKKAKLAFQVDKAAKISSATITGYEAVLEAYKTGQKSPLAAVFPAYPYVQAGLAGAFAAVNIAKIAKSKFQSSGGGGSMDTAGAGGGANAAPMTANFSTIGSSGINQLAQLQQQPTQAYVVSGEVTSAQALDRNRVQNATL